MKRFFLSAALGYVKKPNSLVPLFKLIYRKYPKFIEAVRTRHIRYNECLKTLNEWCNRGTAFRIRPSESFDISRLEKDKSKLARLYDLGVKDMTALMPELKDFLEE